MHSDASATLGIVNRQGLGKLRHVKVQYLWLQEKVRDKSLVVTKVAGPDNAADLMTRYLPAVDMEKHLEYLGIDRRDNRATAAPRLAMARQTPSDHWHEDEATVSHSHNRPSLQLFTPARINGQPPAEALASTRQTTGKYLDTGEEFKVVYDWRNRKTAHRSLGSWWTGSTVFLLRQ